MPRIIDQFGCKRCQKKHKEVSYQLLKEFFQKYSVVHKRSAIKNTHEAREIHVVARHCNLNFRALFSFVLIFKVRKIFKVEKL